MHVLNYHISIYMFKHILTYHRKTAYILLYKVQFQKAAEKDNFWKKAVEKYKPAW